MIAVSGRGRVLAVDLLTAGCVTTFSIFGTVGAAEGAPGGPVELPAWSFVLVVVAALSLAGRRTLPGPTLALGVAATATYLALGMPFGPVLIGPTVAAFSLALHRPPARATPLIAAAAVVLSGAIAVGQDLGPGWPATIGQLLALPGWLAAALAAGAGMRAYRAAASAREAERRRQQTDEQRLQTAREVHDVVGHGLAAISMQAGVALHVLDRSPERARELLTAIRDSSQHALDELRITLAVFRSPEDGADRAPLAGLAGLPAVVDRVADAGLPVDVTVIGARQDLLASVDHAAYRIVQESLTNVLRHAGPTRAVVHLDYRTDRLRIEVTDHGRGPDPNAGSGQGLAGMRTRAEGLGGRFSAGPGPDGGFRVTAELPLSAPGTPTAEATSAGATATATVR